MSESEGKYIVYLNCIARLQMKHNKTVLHCTWMYSTKLDHTAALCTALGVTLEELFWIA